MKINNLNLLTITQMNLINIMLDQNAKHRTILIALLHSHTV